jgi:hypothetical protein
MDLAFDFVIQPIREIFIMAILSVSPSVGGIAAKFGLCRKNLNTLILQICLNAPLYTHQHQTYKISQIYQQ